ncbi:MAG TPA: efflux RND transporter periplasmic adaptor subunit [Silvibacterium sp.]|nr:efflux RND transporter periplasmic adaptor subunit [Silvibacterium sp.]
MTFRLHFRSVNLPTAVALICACTLGASTLSLNGCKKKGAAADDSGGDSAVAVQAEHPTVGPLAEEISADAILAPLSAAAIAARISAPIRAEFVQRGAHVRKGELLLTLEDRDLKGSAKDSKGSLTQAQAAYTAATLATIPEDVQKAQLDVDQAKANMDVANRVAEERKRLLNEGAIAGRDTDTAIAAAVQAQAAYASAVKHLSGVQETTRKTNAEAAQGQLTSARGRLESAEAQLSYANVRSPIDGIVTDRPLFPGETAAAGTPVITVMDTSSLLAKLHVAQATAQKLRVGGSAVISVPGEETAQPATVSLISPALDPGSTTVEIWLKLANPNGRFKVGTPVHAIIRGETIPDAVQLPLAAILPADDGSTYVLVVSADGTAHKQPVKVGLRTTVRVQIIEGVSPGDNVITEGGYGLDDGSKVTVGGDDKDKAGSKE